MSITLEKLASQGILDFENQFMENIERKLVHAHRQTIRDIFSDYIHVSDRIEYVATIFGMDFINDAKSLSANAAWYTLESIEKPIIWIINEINETDDDFEKIIPLIRKKVKAIILLGHKSAHTSHFLADHVEGIYRLKNIEQAVEFAYTIGDHGDAIVFSSMTEDCLHVKNFHDAALQFKRAVKGL
ncbi:MAG: hypothetical protein LBH92_05670 [Bacteroidales bacterium]|jgi:UDP-N-acetylmuramoylalanine--D-glutamate ligase|nr:hypothetical protein [Bacteroidales bacterium]